VKIFPVPRAVVGVVMGALVGLVAPMLAAVGEDSPPDSPPTSTTTLPPTGPAIVGGSTWYADGTKTRSGPAGTPVQAYAVGAFQGVPYRLVLGTGPEGTACASIVSVLNQATIFAGPSGLLGRTSATIPAGVAPGTYRLCFEDSSSGNFTGTGGATFTVQ
jgi:hypothetical protein